MDELKGHVSGHRNSTTPSTTLPLHTAKPLPQNNFNRISGVLYSLAILALLYRHTTTLYHSKTFLSRSLTLSLFVSDLILAFMWVNTQALRICPIRREEYLETLERLIERSDLPAMDIFICTADPYKEPPIGVVNTAMSVMAYDYPKEKISVYVSDDGGSALTLFAFVEAAKFARHWLPFCERNRLVERSAPEAYFESRDGQLLCSPETEELKTMYESMKVKVEHALDIGRVEDHYIVGEREEEVFSKWTENFTRQDHPTVVEVLLDSSKDRDMDDRVLPNLIYVSREKRKASPHHFKAGALNALLRVSAALTNAPIVLTLDCDMSSNDSRTPLRAMCYLCDPDMESNFGYLQFPQRFHGINRDDIYAGEYQRLFQIQHMGFDGLMGPNHVGTGCFFRRRVFFGGPESPAITPEIPELGPDQVTAEPIYSKEITELALRVAGCNYEDHTNWGHKIGFRYGSLVEDYYTGYRLHCEGWRSKFTYPARPAFLGDAPINLVDLLNQQKRWSIGLLEVGFSKYSPVTFGIRSMGLLMGLGYSQYSFWPIWCIPITTYALLPQLALLNKVPIFPGVSDPWFLLYAFLFLVANLQDLVDFTVAGGTFRRWWNDQRIWMLRGVTCYMFGSLEYLLNSVGISAFGFNVTSKVQDDEQSKRYRKGLFEFGVHSPMFVTLTVVAILNLVSFVQGLLVSCFGGDGGRLFGQILLAGFGVVNCWPVYEAMVFRSDKGKIPMKTTLMSTFMATSIWALSASVIGPSRLLIPYE